MRDIIAIMRKNNSTYCVLTPTCKKYTLGFFCLDLVQNSAVEGGLEMRG